MIPFFHRHHHLVQINYQDTKWLPTKNHLIGNYIIGVKFGILDKLSIVH
jgi:hypothetical protein